MVRLSNLFVASAFGASSVLADASSSVAPAASSTAAACNPLKTSGCSPDPALGSSFSETFNSDSSSRFTRATTNGQLNYSSDGLAMTINKRFDNPSLKSDFYIMFGKVEVELKAAAGQGIVSSFYLQSDDLDEIDIEWVGGDTTQFQSNFFSKGDTTTYDRGAFHGVYEPQSEFHNYTVDWAMDQTVWYLDGNAVRTLSNDSSEGYPQTPMYIMMGAWAGGDPSNAPGTIEWAGGLTDYSKAPFTMYVKRVIVTDYSTGSQYSYNGQSGSWESIDAHGGKVYGRYDQAQEDYSSLAGGQTISTSASSSATSSSSSASSSSASSSSASSSSASSSSASSSSASSSSASSSSASSSSSSVSSSSASSASSSSSSSPSSSVKSSSSTSSAAASATSEPASSTVATTTPSNTQATTTANQDAGVSVTSSPSATTLITSGTQNHASSSPSSSSSASGSSTISISMSNIGNMLHLSFSLMLGTLALFI
ncbi:LAMI_0A07536g1_1 [Lachancea mirantina]|uniref:Crh-like protein n=1 Tax=Lachancea mirantina TaxID=1230905 RepID=A0A1G4IQS6_9SACH|nr:LAMI_0A07536g1_1 [Lachancea mirantina]